MLPPFTCHVRRRPHLYTGILIGCHEKVRPFEGAFFADLPAHSASLVGRGAGVCTAPGRNLTPELGGGGSWLGCVQKTCGVFAGLLAGAASALRFLFAASPSLAALAPPLPLAPLPLAPIAFIRSLPLKPSKVIESADADRPPRSASSEPPA